MRAALLELGEVDPHEREQVLAEFLNAGFGSAPEPEETDPGKRRARWRKMFAADSAPVVVPVVDRRVPGRRQGIRRRSVPPRRGKLSGRGLTGLRAAAVRHRVESDSPPAAASTADLARGLAHEHAQTICLVMAHLPPRQAADLLQRLPPARQAEVLRRLGQLETAAPEVMQDLGEALQPWGFAAPGGISAVPGRSPSVEPAFRRRRGLVRGTTRPAERGRGCTPGNTPIA